MSFDTQRLYDLLPVIYRIRDAEQGGPLKELLSIVADQVAVLEEDLEQLYDDQFIETCAAWVVPYIGDLIGYRSLHGVAPKVSSPRAEVAHTIGFRRRKGTAAMLEQLARDVTGWHARVVEFFQLLATTQYMNHIRPTRWYAPDLRQWEPLARLHTPFDRTAHTVDVRRIANGRGLYNIPNIGIFLWRLTAYALTDSPAFMLDDRRYLFSPLGNNTLLFTRPQTEDDIIHLAEPLNVPQPISRRVLDAYLGKYYGKQQSLFLRHADGSDITAAEVEICNLSDAGGGNWAHQPPAGKIAIDPVLGRIAFGSAQTTPPLVTFHYGFSADLGGGEYEREASFAVSLQPVQEVTAPATIQAALTGVGNGGAVQITDSGRYTETLTITVNAGRKLELRAANKHRPTIVLSGDWTISGGTDAEVTLNGLLITGGGLRVPAGADNKLRRLSLRHCTLVPGRSLTNTGEPESPLEPSSLIVELAGVEIELDHCIVGGLRVVESAQVQITDSIVDATDTTQVAYSAPDEVSAGGPLTLVDSTIIGKVRTREMPLASNTIVLARLASGDSWTVPVRVERKQTGCMRFSFVPFGSHTPRRYRCQPDLEIAMQIEQAEKQAGAPLSSSRRDTIRTAVLAWLVPSFSALRYGLPAYAQLRLCCPTQIRTGADDEGEMGAFHKLYHPQRETNVRVRLEEYLRFGLEAGIFYVT
jgi:hypothetical protein